jgi:hypothetical protein
MEASTDPDPGAAMATIHLHQTTTATFTPRPDGTTDVDAVVVRQGKNLKGRLFEILVRTGCKRVLGKTLATTLKAIEARNYQPRQAQS